MKVTRLLAVLKGSTSPALAETEDGAIYVLKLSGAGSGPRGLLTEFIASRIAAAFGAPVPDVAALFVSEGFPWQIGTDEFDATMQRSAGWNLGVRYLPEMRQATPAEVLRADPAVLARIAAADRFLQNVDRSAANTNVLAGPAGELHTIDHDACLYFDRALAGRAPFRFELPEGHLLNGMDLPSSGVPADPEIGAIVADAPTSWVEAIGADRKTVTEALKTYFAAFVA